MATKKKSAPPASSSGLTVEQFCQYIAGSDWANEDFLHWPPDVFALVGALLLKSGAYAHAISGWTRSGKLEDWVSSIKDNGRAWAKDVEHPPKEIGSWFDVLKANSPLSIDMVCAVPDFCNALLQLSAAADEACVGVGCTLPNPKSIADKFRQQASKRLVQTNVIDHVSTLCKRVHHSTIRVLPKLHTPQSGITIRSLSHNLALCPAGDVKAKWAECLSEPRHCLNLLLAPWPLQCVPADFQAVEKSRAELPNLARGFGFFEYNPKATETDIQLLNNLSKLLENAKRSVTKIDGVIFPELSLTLTQYEKFSQELMTEGIFLICGVRDTPRPGTKAAQNYLRFDIPFSPPLSHRQDKHHRWRLDKRQIIQYGLGSCLDLASNWWEHISIGNRELYFVVLDNWLTICPLICEDLARQDPVGELVRAVGPNLVIALLMDGPQLPSRWPARYATVLADDPGSSVLTLTSIGMSQLSRPPSTTAASRAIALWKDAKTGEAVSIDLPHDKQGAVLSLSRVFVKEYTADGRDDGGATGYPTLTGVHYVSHG